MKLLASLLVTTAAWCSISINTAIDVRPTVGSSTNGGGYVVGSGGTNMAIFNNKNAAACTSCQSSGANISTTDGVTNGSTTITSATGNYSSALIGNIVYVAGGTGTVTPARYEVKTVPNGTSFTVDRTTGLSAGTGVTINIGGALDSPVTATLFNTPGNRIYVKNSGTLTVAAAALTANNNETPSSSTPLNMISGYSLVWGDCHAPAATNCTGGRPTIQATAGSNYYILTSGVSGWLYENFILDCNGITNVGGIQSSWYSTIQNMKVTNCLTTSIFANGLEITVLDNEVTAATSVDCISFASNGSGAALRNYVHDADCGGITSAGGGFTAMFNIIDTLSGVGHNGIVASGRTVTIMNNVVYNVPAACASISSIGAGGSVQNNIFSTCGSYGLLSDSAWPAQPYYDGNAFYACSTANRHFVDDTGSVNPIDGAGPYTNVFDISLSVDPFTNAAGADFGLNATSGGGQALKGTGPPRTIQGLTTPTGYISFGVYQPQFGQSSGSGANSAWVQ